MITKAGPPTEEDTPRRRGLFDRYLKMLGWATLMHHLSRGSSFMGTRVVNYPARKITDAWLAVRGDRDVSGLPEADLTGEERQAATRRARRSWWGRRSRSS
jgi:hypothetical protein